MVSVTNQRTASLDVCVIGAGASGLVVMKELLDEGHVVTCFEKADRHGGLFNYGPNKGGVYDSTMLTISNNFMSFSSFPPRDYETPRYWRHTEYFEYLRQFGEKFHVLERISFGYEVLSVRKKDGKVLVEVQNSSGKVTERAFDAIAICVGAHQLPRFPDIPGRDDFKGSINHTFDYKNAEPYRGKNVLCIGAGETAADVVHEIATVANTCTLSLRHYPAIVSRYPGKNKAYPNDAYTSRMLHIIPRSVQSKMRVKESKMVLKDPNADPIRRVIAEWSLHEKNFGSQFLTKSEVFIQDVASGKVDVNISGIKAITSNGAVFNDGSSVTVDAIICNTGYLDYFSFVKDVDISEARQLYRHMFHPALGASVAFIGWARPAEGGVPPCSEMQSRYFALICSGKRTLPPPEKMEELIELENSAERVTFKDAQTVGTLVPYVAYMDAMAELIGCKPKPMKLLRKPGLLYKYWAASLVNDQYRLVGPHADPEAAERVIRSLTVPRGVGEVIAFAVTDTYYLLKKAVLGLVGKRTGIYQS